MYRNWHLASKIDRGRKGYTIKCNVHSFSLRGFSRGGASRERHGVRLCDPLCRDLQTYIHFADVGDTGEDFREVRRDEKLQERTGLMKRSAQIDEEARSREAGRVIATITGQLARADQ